MLDCVRGLPDGRLHAGMLKRQDPAHTDTERIHALIQDARKRRPVHYAVAIAMALTTLIRLIQVCSRIIQGRRSLNPKALNPKP